MEKANKGLSIMITIQNTMGAAAAVLEKARNAFNWSDPQVTFVCSLLLHPSDTHLMPI